MNEWIIIAIVGIVLLFSAKKLPDMARGLGQSMRVFKAETRGMKEDEQAAAAPAPGEAAPGRALEQGGSVNGTAASQPVPQNTVPQNTVEGAPRSGA